jgi:uncharacterized membrane protein YdjX (TVP38/TMEM64 family)
MYPPRSMQLHVYMICTISGSLPAIFMQLALSSNQLLITITPETVFKLVIISVSVRKHDGFLVLQYC